MYKETMDSTKIAVIDVETPNCKNDTICSIGITIIEDNRIIDNKYYLINPETYFDDRCVQIHGITEEDVVDALTFPQVWEVIKDYFSCYLLAGHNLSFDLSCIKKALLSHNISVPPAYYTDTLTISRKHIKNTSNYKLPTLCEMFNISLESHHNALNDSYATAELLLHIIRNYKINIDDYIRQYPFEATEHKHNEKQIFTDATRALQELQGVLIGVTCDGILSDTEIYAVRQWTNNHMELKGNFPFDKIYSSIERVLEDNIITEDERAELLSLFNNILNPVETEKTMTETDISGVKICLSGDFECMSKKALATELENRGAIIKNSIVRDLKYLIIGDKGSEQWAHGTYGAKIKKAMELNEKGCSIEIIKECDFISLIIDE